jgi:flavodoxin I
MYEVIYFSRGGNTRKLALAIADELGVQARFVKTVKALSPGTDIFIGSGLYFMRPAKLIRHFIKVNDFRGRKVFLFGTSTSGLGIETAWMERLIRRKGATVVGTFYCPGKFSLRLRGPGAGPRASMSVRGGRPGIRDLANARRFARLVGWRDTVSTKATPVPNGVAVPASGLSQSAGWR